MMQIGWYTLDQNTIFRNRSEVPCWYEDVKCFAGKYAVYTKSFHGSFHGNSNWVVVPGFVVEDYFPSVTTRTIEEMTDMNLPYDKKKHTGAMSGHGFGIGEDKLAEVVATHEVYKSGRWELLSNFESRCRTLYNQEKYWDIVQSADGDEIEDCGYGLYLDTEEADTFCRAYGKADGMDPSNVPLFAVDFRCANLADWYMYDYGQIQHLDGQFHAEDGKALHEGLFLYAYNKCYDASMALLHAGEHYPGIQEMADACRRMYAAYLPSGFNYEAHAAFSTQTYSKHD